MGDMLIIRMHVTKFLDAGFKDQILLGGAKWAARFFHCLIFSTENSSNT